MSDGPQSDHLGDAGLDGVLGEFWIDGGPRVPGTVHYSDGRLRVVTEGIARLPRSYRMGEGVSGGTWMEFSLDPPDGVADFAPVPLLGTLEDGRAITVVDGRLSPGPPIPTQEFWGATVLIGVHTPTVSTQFAKARVALPQAPLWSGVFADRNVREIRLGERAGSLRAVVDGEIGWLELTLDDGLMAREWERRFCGRVVTLLRLWTHAEPWWDRVQLSLGADGGWVDLLHAGAKTSETVTAWQSLLPPGSLTLDTVHRALCIFDELAPVPEVASKRMTERATVEQAVLSNAAALEGLHRPRESAPFPAVEDPRPIAKVAAEAATTALVEQGLLAQQEVPATVRRLTTTFALFNQPTFAERLRELLPPVEAVAPGLIGPRRSRWVRDVTDARHREAHRFISDPSEREAYRQRVDNYIQLAISTEWVLRIALLLRLDVPPELLHERLLDHQQFEYELANMDHAEDPPGSRLAEFRASRKVAVDGAGEPITRVTAQTPADHTLHTSGPGDESGVDPAIPGNGP